MKEKLQEIMSKLSLQELEKIIELIDVDVDDFIEAILAEIDERKKK